MGQRHQMARRQAAIFVLDKMQMLDQEISPPRPVPQKGLNLAMGVGIQLPSFGMNGRPGTPRAGMGEFTGDPVVV